MLVADPRILPGDIQDYFTNDRTIQQAWRLVKGYIRSPQKQRERGFRVSRYVLYSSIYLIVVLHIFLNISTHTTDYSSI